MTERGIPLAAREALLLVLGGGLLWYEAAHPPAEKLIVAAACACLGLVPLSFVERILGRHFGSNERPARPPREDP